MGNTKMQNRISMDTNAADDHSLDSLSFAGLVCIQDQQSKATSPTKSRPNGRNDAVVDDQEFEFVSGTSLQSSNKIPHHPDMIISSNNDLLPLELLLKSAQSQAGNKPHRTKVSQKSANREAKINQDKRNKTGSKSSFGQKLFQSFVSPCRECQAASPTVKAHAVQRERVELRK